MTSNPFFFSIGSIVASRPLKFLKASRGSIVLPEEYIYFRTLLAISVLKTFPDSLNASNASASSISAQR